MGIYADVQRRTAQAHGAVGVAVEVPTAALRAAPFKDGVVKKDDGLAVQGVFMVGPDPAETFAQVGVGAKFIVVVAADQADFAIEFGKQAEGFGKAAKGDVAQVIDAVAFAHLRVPACNHRGVHFGDVAEGAVAVFDDVVVKKVGICCEINRHVRLPVG